MVKRIVGDDQARLLSKIDKSGGPDACWPFTGAISGNGYGNFGLKGKTVGAHRAVWLFMVGDIPEGLEVDHTCHNEDLSCKGGKNCPHRRCMNWERHMRLTTHRENDLAGVADRPRTHCKNDHKYTPENSYVWFDPKRGRDRIFCRECNRIRSRKGFTGWNQ
jgi:hypothetical protein